MWRIALTRIFLLTGSKKSTSLIERNTQTKLLSFVAIGKQPQTLSVYYFCNTLKETELFIKQ